VEAGEGSGAADPAREAVLREFSLPPPGEGSGSGQLAGSHLIIVSVTFSATRKNQTMLRQAGFAAVIFLAGSYSILGLAATPRKTEKPDPGRQAVDKVLRDEIGLPLDRREKLSETLKSHPESSSVRWQSGYIHDGNDWHSYDVAASITNSDAWREYLSRRQNSAATFDGQLALADWCRTRHLFDQEQAHLTAALPIAPQNRQPAILQRLGYVQVGTHN
jgi:hypothetical protein